MSTGSWDDSSTLVKDLPSPTNNDKDDVFGKKTDTPSHVAQIPSDPKHKPFTASPVKSKKSKAAKGLGFLLKAREGAKKRSKSPLKSPSKSPSKEILTSELTDEDLAANEKLKVKSEHWQAFMHMQDRIKSNVLKTQTALLQTGRISPSGRVSPCKPDKEDHTSSPWTQFDKTECDYQSDSQQYYDNSYQDDVTGDFLCDQVVPDANDDFTSLIPSLHVTTSKHSSKQGDSRRSSMEQQNLTDVLEFENIEKTESKDPFGLSLNQSNGNSESQPSVVISEDLLGLEDFLGSGSVQSTPPVHDSGNDWFSGYNSSVQSSAQSSLCSSPTGFDQDFLNDPKSTAVSDLARSLVDDFMQWGAETAEKDVGPLPISTNPFHTPALPPKGVRVPPTTPDIFDPLKSCTDNSMDELWGSPSLNQNTLNVFQNFGSLEPTNIQLSNTSQSVATNVDSNVDIFSTSAASDSFGVTNSFGTTDSFDCPPVQASNNSALNDVFNQFSASPANSPIKIARQPSGKTKKHDPFSALFKAAKDPVAKVDDDEDEPMTLAALKAKADHLKGKSDTQSDIISHNISSIDIESVSKCTNSDSDPFGMSVNPVNSDFSNPFDSAPSSDPFYSDQNKQSTQGATNNNPDPFDAWGSIPSKAAQVTSTDPFMSVSTNKKCSQMELEDDDFFSSRGQSVAPLNDAWGAIDSGISPIVTNPFEDDPFTADHIPMQTENEMSNDLSSKPKNPFLTASFENIAAENKNTQPSLFLGESTFGLTTDSQNSQMSSSPSKKSATKNETESSDPFDPFHDKKEDHGQETQAMDFLGTPEKRMSTSDYDNLDEDEKETFKLEIKTSARPLLESGPTPMLPPPPKPPKSPQLPFRENPFDRDSPPEENFAKFEVVEEELKSKPLPEPRERIMSTSTESSTPDDEEDHLPLEDFHPRYEKEGWKLMLRQPTKKKLAGNRFWKPVFVKIVKTKEGLALQLFTEENQNDPFQELPLQPCYMLSDMSLQQYDQFGKIHTVKIQYVFYRERVGIRPERITPSFVRKPKPTMILDHAPQMSELLKFGSLDENDLRSFVWEVEDAFMKLESYRDKTLSYTKDEVTAEVWEEYVAQIDKLGHVKYHKGRCRLFFLAFVTGMPWCELGLNDKRRKGREVVGRHDIIPVKTEDWINIESPEFHCSVDLDEYERTHTIKFHPLDACKFELCRFRVRPKYNRELPLQVRCQQTLKDRHFEIRCDMLVTGYHANTKKHGQFPCEDIELRFNIPDTWIYLFKYEKRFGYGSFKASARKPGKIKGLERITMMAQGSLTPTLMEASSGTAKYENLHHAVVWRIARLPERNQGAYKSHLFVLRLDLGPHDEVPETFEETCHVHFTMPSSTISKTQVRSVSVDNPNPPEKWVRYIAKYTYEVEIETSIESSEQDGSD
ncbi:protein stoned-B isoform X1 [Patella vulgata]|uniref:protein stoned-B isoform X1 n=1 Tax=Patella vulgata TaxID=6465 RepID=UPI0024A81289|nr:protein stoned-B isoform X1 [Patella vulgata]XP_050406706.2 protein stoned-B isoform X1 [Patella vulgata]